MVDTCAAEFEAATPYYYSCYADEDEVKPWARRASSSSVRAQSASVRYRIRLLLGPFGLGPAQSRHEQHHRHNNPGNGQHRLDSRTACTLNRSPSKTSWLSSTRKTGRRHLPVRRPDGYQLAPPLAKRGVTVLGTSVDVLTAPKTANASTKSCQLNIPVRTAASLPAIKKP